MWTGTPGGTLGTLANVLAPKPATANASGFVAFDLEKLLGDLPSVPLAGGVTLDAFAKTLAGPITAVIPAGSTDIQVTAPLNDVGPARTVLEHCKDLAMLLDLVEPQPADACRFKMQSAGVLELEPWVEEPAKELRIGAHQAGAAKGTENALTPIGKELARGDWTAMFWGRGTMLNLAGIEPASNDLPPTGAAAIHTLALVDELGLGLMVDERAYGCGACCAPSGRTRRRWRRRSSRSPPRTSSTATRPRRRADPRWCPGLAVRRRLRGRQGGLMVPAVVLGIASAVIVPAIE